MINVFIIELTPRIQYSFRLIFETILNNKVAFYTNSDEYHSAIGPKINYSDHYNFDGLYLQPHSLLQENIIYDHVPEFIEWDGEMALYPVTHSFIPFDIFAAAFYLVARYEEYLPGKRDAHHRFMATESLAVKNGFIDVALVNRWALKLANIIEKEYPDFIFSRTDFTYLPTIDIDNAWAFRNKGLFRTAFSLTKDIVNGRFSLLIKRLKVLSHIEKDKYDTYDFLLTLFKKYRYKPIYFFLLNEFGKYDRSVPYSNYQYQKLILKISKSGSIGIHPSYNSHKSERILFTEIEHLRDITGNIIDKSRQHFLKMEMPYTYQKLIKQGIRNDYSMGYADYSGFRASIATPFYFFDIIENKITTLKITPFQVMDVSLLKYQKLNPAEALVIIEKLLEETKKVGGTFVSLWHNESLNDEGEWSGWQNVYTEMTRKAFELSYGKNN